MKYVDKQLTWGAKLSAYQQLFDSSDFSSKTFVGIELIEDVPLPTNYVVIDHHNERSDRPASIEQIAELLGIQLSYYQQLIAANDKGYIPAMRAMNASEEEIRLIRYQDRKAQGVTEEDEHMAEEAVLNLIRRQDVVIVYTLSNRFSPITDRLQEQKLIVWNDHSLNYYGKHKVRLVQHFADWIETGKAYHGGGDAGFFGLVSGAFGKGEIEEVIQEIVELVS